MNKSRPSTHLLVLLIIIALTALGHYTIHYSALIRGYETSLVTAGRNLLLFVPLMASVIILSRVARFAGNWTLFTTAVLLFSIGLVGQYRLFSDPEYVSVADKAQAREQKIETQQLRYIKEHYSAEKKRIMGLPATPPAPINLADETPRPAPEGIGDVLFSGKTLIPLFAFACFLGAFLLFRKERVLDFFQNNGFLLVLLTLVPLMVAAVTSQAGKSIGNMTPWEMSKVPFLLGFAAILTVLYRNLTKTYWGVPRGRDVVPLIFMAAIPFVPFLVLKDFGQMLVFASAYTVLYLVAVKRLPQRLVFVGSVAFLIAILTLAVLPTDMQTRVPLLSTIAEPLKKALPGRIHQRFYLWFEALKPPPSDTFWWKDDFENFYAEEYRNEIIEKNPDLLEKAAPAEKQIAPLVAQLNSLPRGDSRRAELQKKINELQRPVNAEVKERAKQELAELRQTAYPPLADTENVGENPSNIENNQPPNPEALDDYSDPTVASLEEQKAARARLDSLNEEAWFADDALQASRATFGISSGGKTGRGLGLGFPELIPVADSDYIYAALGEETGLIGGFLIILTLIVFVNAGIRTALDARDMFTKLCAAGLTAFIGFQGLVNIGGITRALPMTGITLPFVSHGGFSLITSFVMLGMLLAISHRNGIDAQFNGTKPPENG
ncbi:MAG: FtsW/RodA/SpoVE family cell cycle protein [Acidobacteriota bacterium]|nr:FtsW/RodA/SpoVE family cell cycle protein [Acidobacteriota bacterium]